MSAGTWAALRRSSRARSRRRLGLHPRRGLPHPLGEDVDAAGRRVAVGPRQPGHRDAGAAVGFDVLGVIEIDEQAVGIEHRREVADAADEVMVVGDAAGGIGRRFENRPEVDPRPAVIVGAGGADARPHLARPGADHAVAFVVIEAVPGFGVANHALEPEAAVRRRRCEGHRALSRQPLNASPLAQPGAAGHRVEHRHAPLAVDHLPNCRAVRVGFVRKGHRRRWAPGWQTARLPWRPPTTPWSRQPPRRPQLRPRARNVDPGGGRNGTVPALPRTAKQPACLYKLYRSLTMRDSSAVPGSSR